MVTLYLAHDFAIRSVQTSPVALAHTLYYVYN